MHSYPFLDESFYHKIIVEYKIRTINLINTDCFANLPLSFCHVVYYFYTFSFLTEWKNNKNTLLLNIKLQPSDNIF